MLKTVNVREVVEKEVVRFGNGSIVYTPKKWVGQKVLVILEEKLLDINGETMEILKPYLSSIEGVFLFGSFARNEQSEKSDIDLLIIADKKISLEKLERFDFLVKTKDQFIKEIRTDPTFFPSQIIREAKPILNERLLSELKLIEAKPDFKIFFDDTVGAFKKITSLLETNEDKTYLDSNTAIYSLILRLKTLFLMQCHMKGQIFSNKKLKEFLMKNGFVEESINNMLGVYQSERDEQETSQKILLADVKKLFYVAKIEFLKTEELVKKIGQRQIQKSN